MRHLAFHNSKNEVSRTLPWDSEPLHVVFREDNQRLEFKKSIQDLRNNKIRFLELGVVTADTLKSGEFSLGRWGSLREMTFEESFSKDVESSDLDSTKKIGTATFAVGVILFVLLGVQARKANEETPILKESAIQQAIKIIKRSETHRPKTVSIAFSQSQDVEKKTAESAVHTRGALGILGSLKKSSQKGGVDLGAVQTTAGPGLGGTAGSGGVQTQFYGKGLISAPLGVGGRADGAGGYGTHGKGGGKAGYGTLSLVGSAGGVPVPLGAEALVDGGLDREAISEVIRRNLGQVRFCYEQGLQGDGKLSGRVAVDFVIAGDGVVSRASVAQTTLNSKGVEDCILLRLKTWKFPVPVGGKDVKVSYPFVLRRTGV